MQDAAELSQNHPYLDGYQPVAGVADELYDAQGRMRPVWRPFVEAFSRLSPDEVRARFGRADQYLRDAGVYFRQYSHDPNTDRDWPLSHIPVVLHEREWEAISAELAQRADLLEAVMADLYGEGRLVSEGHLPAELIAGNRAWLRPMVGVRPRGGHYLHFLAFEIGRSPDGSWLVLGDRAQAPSGAGFALENRMATGRIFPESFPRARIHRLAGFFSDFRTALGELAVDDHGRRQRVGILTPGPANDSYYEHTYIARYLGIPLLEGEDLLVQEAQAMLRTIEGPEPLGVLWRRIDASFADPLELDPGSWIGTPGLMEAIRAGQLAMVNALGSGVLETRALMAFLPRISEVLTGRPLDLPNIATWWCGSAAERAYVLDNAERMLIGPAKAVNLPFDLAAATAPGGDFHGLARPAVEAWIEAEGGLLVGQEAVTLSTTPAWREDEGADAPGGHVRPCPMTIRVFAARTPQGWTFMKGGYARIGPEGEPTALAMQRGGRVADVWIVSDRDVPPLTLARRGDAPFRRQAENTLPARAADNLFWLGRYIERCEGAMRLVRSYHLRLAGIGTAEDPRLDRLDAFVTGFGIDLSEPVPGALIQQLDAARGCAAKIRDRFSTDGWLALQDLAKTARQMTQTAQPGDDAAGVMRVLLRKITGFSGLVHENMYRSEGWRFLSIGRALERADGMAALIAAFVEAEAPAGSLDLAVEVADSVITHQRRYRVETSRETVVDLLALDAENPRSVLFQLGELKHQIEALPGAVEAGRPGEILRLLLPLWTALDVAAPEDVTSGMLGEIRAGLARLSDLVSQDFLR
ncbi:MAG: circularly permuted type 2 ATP-grasp protein [Maritimibacter sp.]|nr:circularly permuted type 2 ATP-grasp protein [Maritimibacter sp.]